jgi:radical SAM protein with 4Fe4S-binding SPASM domain
METLTLSAFANEILDSQRVPLNGTLELTFRCNMRCGFCYCPAAPERSKDPELDTQEIRHIIDEIVDAGCLTLLLTGGEPLVRHDFKEIYAYIGKQGVFVTLFTNGTCLREDVADILCAYPPKKVEITLYGATPQTHEKVTGIPGSFAACLRGIELMLARKLPLVLKSTVSMDNYHEIPMMMKYAQELGVDYRWDPMLDPRMDGGQMPCEYRLTPRQIVEIDRLDPEKLAGFRRLCAREPQVADRELVYLCGAGEGSFHINPYGQMSMCSLTRYAAYDLRRGSFRQGFHHYFPRLRSQRFEEGQIGPCTDCKLLNLCTNCPGTAFLENACLHQPSRFHCEVARLRSLEAAMPL